MTHRQWEAKRARRLKRTSGPSRGKVRGPVTRGASRAALMNVGEHRIFTMVASTRPLTRACAAKRKAAR